MEKWSSMEALAELALEREFLPSDDPAELEEQRRKDWQLGCHVLESGFPVACAAMVWLAAQSTDEKIRFRSAKAIIDSVTTWRFAAEAANNDPILKFVQDVENIANNPASKRELHEKGL